MAILSERVTTINTLKTTGIDSTHCAGLACISKNDAGFAGDGRAGLTDDGAGCVDDGARLVDAIACRIDGSGGIDNDNLVDFGGGGDFSICSHSL